MTTPPVDSARSIRDNGLVCCTVGDEQYALRGADVRQISRVEQMQIGAGPDGRVGTLEVARQTVPVFALGRVLGRPGASGRGPQGGGRHIAVTGTADARVGWLVDRIARTPVSEDTVVVPLPSIVGKVATTWFEGLVKLGDSSVLLLAPQYLNPLACQAMPADLTDAFHAPSPNLARQPQPMVVIFSTPALPRCHAPRYALSGRQIAAVVQPAPRILVPGSAPHVTGVSWWRNAVVPVVDFRDPDDRDQTAPRPRCIIAQCGARLRGTLVAFAIDSEIALHRPAAGDQQVSDVTRPAFADGMFAVGGEVVALVNLDALLAADSPAA